MRGILWAVCVVGFLAPWQPHSPALAATAPSAHIDYSAAINKAGRQRMLSQRIVKFYCQIGQDILAEKAKPQLQQSIALFESQLGELRQLAPNDETRAAVENMEGAWRPFKVVVLAPPSTEGAKKLIGLSEDLLQAAQKTTLLFQNAAGTQTGRLVNVSGRQRMLSQRLARLYLHKRRGLNLADVNEGLEQTRSEFAGALAELLAAPQTTPEIKKQLELARMQWIFFENALNQDSTRDPSLAVNVATTSERILEVMDKVTGMYEKLDSR